jgi:hypothetical protein
MGYVENKKCHFFIPAKAGIELSILLFPVFTGTSLDSRWSLSRT